MFFMGEPINGHLPSGHLLQFGIENGVEIVDFVDLPINSMVKLK